MIRQKISPGQINQELFGLFKQIFTQNCQLDEESITEEEAKTLKELDSLEIIENFKDLINNLLNFKKIHKHSTSDKLQQKVQKREASIQMLEAEVRTHIRQEQQVKLTIDVNRGKIEEMERNKAKISQKVKDLQEQIENKDSNPAIETYIREIEQQYKKEISKLTAMHRQRICTDFREGDQSSNESKITALRQLAQQRLQKIHLLENECNNIRKEIQQKDQNYKQIKSEYDKVMQKLKTPQFAKNDNGIYALKRELDEKQAQINKLQSKAPQKIPIDKTSLSKTTKGFYQKSSTNAKLRPSDPELFKYYSKRDEIVSKEGSRVGTVKRRTASRGHTRSTSETLKYISRV